MVRMVLFICWLVQDPLEEKNSSYSGNLSVDREHNVYMQIGIPQILSIVYPYYINTSYAMYVLEGGYLY